MGENTKISWATHTFNPVRGCSKVSSGCLRCYAETLSKRNPGVLGVWGDDGTRVVASEAKWKEVAKWDRKARDAVYDDYSLEERRNGSHLLARPRVFCASLADVFEDRPEWIGPRARLFRLIDSTPFLDWLLLTKRPENIERFLPDNSNIEADDDGTIIAVHVEGRDCEGMEGDCCWGSGWLPQQPFPIPCSTWRPNLWLGVTVENRKHGLPRIDVLREVPAAVRFLSIEPLLEDLGEIDLTGIGWVIAGCESGPGARPMEEDWVRSIRDQCVAASVPFFYKQKLINGHKLETPDLDGRRWTEMPTAAGAIHQ